MVDVLKRSGCFESVVRLNDIVNLVQVPLAKRGKFMGAGIRLHQIYLVDLCEVMNHVDSVILFVHGVSNCE